MNREKPRNTRRNNEANHLFGLIKSDRTVQVRSKLELSNTNIKMGDYLYDRCEGYLNTCKACGLQSQCMRKPVANHGRQVSIRIGHVNERQNMLKRMQTKIDSRQGRHIYSGRIGTVEAKKR